MRRRKKTLWATLCKTAKGRSAHGICGRGVSSPSFSSCMLGWAAVPAAAIGSMLADLMGGYVMYLLPTFLIKAAVAAVAVLAVRSGRGWMRVLGLIAAEAVMVGGYFLVEWLILGYGLAAATASVPGNCLQGLSGVIIGLLLIPLMKRVRL